MNRYFETPTIGEILKEEFLEPLNITVKMLSQGINVPFTQIQDILYKGKRMNEDLSFKVITIFWCV